MNRNEDPVEKMDGKSMNISIKNQEIIKKYFPSVIIESIDDQGNPQETIDFEKLKAELGFFSEAYERRKERYGMDWPGKKDTIKLIQKPSTATLKPVRKESVNFDETENLVIEGDNLEVLKLLQKSYYGKVKMIYIDPPYNTGNDFVYSDDFIQPLNQYLEMAGLTNDLGKKMTTNTYYEGRYHSNWLNMLYPRLYLARNLLTEEGLIFISIDDNEVRNLKILCDEIFGEDNFISQITVLNNPKGRSQDKYLATCHEYILIYSKILLEKGSVSIPKSKQEIISDFPLIDQIGRYRELELRNTHREFGRHNRPNLFYPIYVRENGEISLEYIDEAEQVFPIWDDGFEGCWTWGSDKAINEQEKIIAKKVNNNWKIYRKAYASNPGEIPLKQLKSIWNEKIFHTEKGQKEFNSLFNSKEKIFQAPKSVDLIKNCILMSQSSDMIVLDFFSGSSTTAQSVIELNQLDNGKRKFIMVQLPEPCEEKSEAYKAGYSTISEIGKERIRRVIRKIEKEIDESNKQKKISSFNDESNEKEIDIDLGFKVLKLDKSNFKAWQDIDTGSSEETISDAIQQHLFHIDPESSQEDILYEILLKAGFMPTEKIEELNLADKKVFSISNGALLICLEDDITRELIEAVAEAEPMQFICLDSGFHDNDQLKTNAVQTFNAKNLGKEKSYQIVFRTI